MRFKCEIMDDLTTDTMVMTNAHTDLVESYIFLYTIIMVLYLI